MAGAEHRLDEERPIPLAALQHYAFCPRQCALIHNEGIWAENWHTARGALLHDRVHTGDPEVRRGVRQERGVTVAAPSLGLVGKLDLLEIDLATGALCPVEYKKGRSKTDDWDRVQLCAQVLCLEEMRGVRIDEAALWYWQTRRRERVTLTEELRARTRGLIGEVRALLASDALPPPLRTKQCRQCSLADDCAPDGPDENGVRRYVRALLSSGADPEMDEEAGP